MKKASIRRIALIMSVILLMGVLVGCEKDTTTEGGDETSFLDNTDASKTEVMKVGDEIVYLDEVNVYALQYAYSFALTTGDLSVATGENTTYSDYHKEQLLSKIREAKIEYYVAKQEGIELTEEQMASMNTGVKNFMNAMDDAMLDYFGITEEVVRKCFLEQMYNSALEATVEYEGEIEDYQITTIYYLTFLTVQMDEEGNLVTDESGNPMTLSDDDIEDVKTKADEALAKINDGEDIEAVAEEYGLSYTSGEQSSVYGNFADEMNVEIDKLEDGENSDVFTSDYGYNIVKLITKNNEDEAANFKEYYKSSMRDQALLDKQTEWFKSVEIDVVNDMYDDTWDRFSFVPFTAWFEQLGLNTGVQQ